LDHFSTFACHLAPGHTNHFYIVPIFSNVSEETLINISTRLAKCVDMRSCAKEDHVNRFRVFSSASSSLRRHPQPRLQRHTNKQRFFVSFFLRVTSFATPQPYLISFLAQPHLQRHNATSSLSSRSLVYHATTLSRLFPRATLSRFSRVLRSPVSNFVSPCAFRIYGVVRVFFCYFFPPSFFFFRLKEFFHLSLGYRYQSERFSEPAHQLL
jgi:hypothetical protein